MDVGSPPDVPGVAQADAILALDEQSILVELRDHDGALNRFRIGTTEVCDFVTMLLRVANLANAPSTDWPDEAQSVPASALCVAERDDGKRCLGIKVGPTTLFFEVPKQALSSVGQTLLDAAPV